MKLAESYPNDWKTLREKEKLLVTSNFSFSHSVFKRLVLQTRKNQGLFGKGLKGKKNVEKGGVFETLMLYFLSKNFTLVFDLDLGTKGKVFRPGNPSQGIPLPIGIVSCLFRQKCCFVCPLYIAESAKTTSFPSIYRDCLSHGVNAFLSSKLSSSKRHGIARVLQSFNN